MGASPRAGVAPCLPPILDSDTVMVGRLSYFDHNR
jgi:hypothetical protein